MTHPADSEVVGSHTIARGHLKEIKFPFNLEEDTAEAVASEMMQELEFSEADLEHIARGIH